MGANSTKFFYTPEEFRQILPCGRSLMYESLRQRRIRSFKLGNKIFIPASEIIRLKQLADDNVAFTEDSEIIDL